MSALVTPYKHIASRFQHLFVFANSSLVEKFASDALGGNIHLPRFKFTHDNHSAQQKAEAILPFTDGSLPALLCSQAVLHLVDNASAEVVVKICDSTQDLANAVEHHWGQLASKVRHGGDQDVTFIHLP